MNWQKGVFVFLILLLSSPVWSQEDTNHEAVCQKIRDLKQVQKTAAGALGAGSVWDALRLSLLPASIGQFKEVEIKTAPKVSAPGRVLRNVIFLMGPTPETSAEVSLPLAQERIENVEKQLAPLKAALGDMLKADTISDCQAKATTANFDLNQFNHWQSELSNLDMEKQVIEYEQSKSIMKAVSLRLKLDWEFKEFTRLSDLYVALQSTDIENIVIISHATANWELVDSESSVYPNSFFSRISPSIRSLAIFSCHSDGMENRYHIAEILGREPTEYSKRYFFYMENKNFLGTDNFVILQSVAPFLTKLENYLIHGGTERTHGVASAEASECSVKIQDLGVERGRLGIFLNQSYIGVASPTDEAGREYAFPCAWISQEGQNSVGAWDLSLKQEARVRRADFQADIVTPSNTYHLKPARVFLKSDGSYLSSKAVGF